MQTPAAIPPPYVDPADWPNPRWLKSLRALLFFNFLALAPIVAGVIIEVETIIVTGPILLLVGVAVIITGRKSRHPTARLVGLAQCAVCLITLALILIFSWGPRQAQIPVSAIAVLYAIIITPALIHALFFTKPDHDPHRCRTCNYPLIGLPSPRCPECGTPFDPFQVPNWPKEGSIFGGRQ